MTKVKLTKKEIKEVEGMRSYFESLDLDVDGEGTHEKDFVRGLGKLLRLYYQQRREKKA